VRLLLIYSRWSSVTSLAQQGSNRAQDADGETANWNGWHFTALTIMPGGAPEKIN